MYIVQYSVLILKLIVFPSHRNPLNNASLSQPTPPSLETFNSIEAAPSPHQNQNMYRISSLAEITNLNGNTCTCNWYPSLLTKNVD